MSQPNILFVFADQLQAFTLGCMGNPDCRTPVLDRLAAEGALFRSAYSAAPVCTPFRGTLLSGRYASQTGITGNGPYFLPGERLLPDCLNEAGYHTSYVGKWHLGGQGNVAIPRELRAGFTDFIGYQCYNSFRENIWFFDEQNRRHTFEGHRTAVTTDLALARLRTYGPGPWATFVSYQSPHYPMQAQPEHLSAYEGRDLTMRPNYVPDCEPYTATYNPFTGATPDEDPVKQGYHGSMIEYIRQYYAMVSQLDAEVGRLLAGLQELGVADRTVVVFTSDHGDLQGSHGLRNKGPFWEESAAIPLIVRLPGGPARDLAQPVNSVDFMPTLLELAGAPAEPTTEGTSFAGLLRGDPEDPGAATFVEPRTGDSLMLREGPWKLVVDLETLAPRYLFDLGQDPCELQNRVDDADVAKLRDRLQERLAAWHRDVQSRVHPNFRERPPAPAPPPIPEAHQALTAHELAPGESLRLEPARAQWQRGLRDAGDGRVQGFETEHDRLLWEVHVPRDLTLDVTAHYACGADDLATRCLLEVATAPTLALQVEPVRPGAAPHQLAGPVTLRAGRNIISFRLNYIPGVCENWQATETGLTLASIELTPPKENA